MEKLYSFPFRYNALSVVPAALGKKVRDVAAKVDIFVTFKNELKTKEQWYTVAFSS